MNILEEEELPSKNVLMSTKRRAGSVIWAWIATIVIAVMLLQHAALPSPGVIVRKKSPYEQLLIGVVPGTVSFGVVIGLLCVLDVLEAQTRPIDEKLYVLWSVRELLG